MARDPIDREAEWQAKRAEMEDIRGLKDSFELNIGNNIDKMLAIVKGKYKAPALPQDSDRISRPNDIGKKVSKAGFDPEEQSMPNESGMFEGEENEDISEPKFATTSHRVNKYAQLVNQLDRFPFSEDPAEREKQLNIVAAGIRTAMGDLINKEVASNTKKAFKQYLKKVQKVAGGLRFTYDFGEGEIYVVAKGNFFGDETVCVEAQNNKLVGSVIKISSNGDVHKLNDQFDITISEG